MCEQIIKFCNNSARPLLYAGASLVTFLAAIIGYSGYATRSLYSSIDPSVAGSSNLGFYLQFAALGYLLVVALLSCHAAHYDQKHSIRALALLSSINCIVALAMVLVVPSPKDVSQMFIGRLEEAKLKYNFTERFPNTTIEAAIPQAEKIGGSVIVADLKDKAPIKRWAETPEQPEVAKQNLSSHEATELWDKLQARGCCGIQTNSTWDPNQLPKSCCSEELRRNTDKGGQICQMIDLKHQHGCLELIGKTSDTLKIVLILIALANLYLAIVSGISTYRTIHYSEASQSAYT